jgi:hypothetical protein
MNHLKTPDNRYHIQPPIDHPPLDTKDKPVGQTPPPNKEYIKYFVKEFYSEYLHTTYYDEVREILERKKNT